MTFGEGAGRAGGKQVQCEAEGGRGEEGREGKGAKEGKVTLGTEVRERKQSLLLRWRRRGVISEENVRWTRREER